MNAENHHTDPVLNRFHDLVEKIIPETVKKPRHVFIFLTIIHLQCYKMTLCIRVSFCSSVIHHKFLTSNIICYPKFCDI